jgi:hypothetical protein
MKKSEALEQVQNCVSSIFTKDDVIKIISSISESEKNSPFDIEEFKEKLEGVTDLIMNNIELDDIVEPDEVEFEISYNRKIEVTDVPVNFSVIRQCIDDALKPFIETIDEYLKQNSDENSEDKPELEKNQS